MQEYRDAGLLFRIIRSCVQEHADTPHPVRLSFSSPPTRDALRERIEAEIRHYYDDVHGAPAWRRHMTLQFAEEIRRDLAGEGPQ